MLPAHGPKWLLLVAAVMFAVAGAPGAAAAGEDKKTEARRLYDEATAAFGLGSYAEAAEKYEGSFKLHPDPALLYNAAQAYRMAGNQTRALQLYRNFARIYGDNPRAEDARNHAAALEKALAEPARPAPATPSAPSPTPATSPPAVSLNAPALAAAPAVPLLVEQPAPSGSAADESLVRKPWFWVAVGAVLVGGTVAVLLATRKDEYPTATLGTF